MDDNIYFFDDDDEDHGGCGGSVRGGDGEEVEDPVASLLGVSNTEAAAPPPPTVLPQSTTMNTPQSKSNSTTVIQQQQEAMSQSPMMHKTMMMTPPPTTTPSGGASTNSIKSVDELNEDLANLLLHNHALPQSSIMAMQGILRENDLLKEKNNKLKSLLGRSAKAQRDVKNELETLRKAHDAALNICTQLEKRLEVLANRPTHMDLLADFETNFDRALLSASSMGIGGGGLSRNHSNNQQSGGEDAAETTTSMTSMYDNMVSSSSSSSGKRSSSRSVSDPLLTIEFAEAQDRITHLQTSNTTLQERVLALEHDNQTLLLDNTATRNTATNLQLELRMSKMETEHHVRTIKDKDANITEMQLEIDLVTQSAVDANRRAAEGYVVAQTARSDKEYVEGLEMKVVALQEWALASTESKQLTLDRCRGLESRVKELEGMIYQLSTGVNGAGDGTLLSSENNLPPQTPLVDYTPHRPTLHHPSSSSSSVGCNSSMGGNDNEERPLWTKSSSLVIGAGMIGHVILELGQAHIESYETIVLRWKFDITPNDLDIYFSILKGSVNCVEDKKLMRGADACFRHRHVTGGGGGGDVSGAFAKQNSCTLLWSNEMSWVRPRTIKWTVEAVAIEWND